MFEPGYLACGALVTDARKRTGKSIAQMGEDLGIRPAYLEMLEKGELHREMGPGYFRNILIAYANGVGLDGERLLAELHSDQHVASAPTSAGVLAGATLPVVSSPAVTVAGPEVGQGQVETSVASSAAMPGAAAAVQERISLPGSRRAEEQEARASDSLTYTVVMVVLLVLGIATSVFFALPLLGLVG